jgi:hypothetical protein
MNDKSNSEPYLPLPWLSHVFGLLFGAIAGFFGILISAIAIVVPLAFMFSGVEGGGEAVGAIAEFTKWVCVAVAVPFAVLGYYFGYQFANRE